MRRAHHNSRNDIHVRQIEFCPFLADLNDIFPDDDTMFQASDHCNPCVEQMHIGTSCPSPLAEAAPINARRARRVDVCPADRAHLSVGHAPHFAVKSTLKDCAVNIGALALRVVKRQHVDHRLREELGDVRENARRRLRQGEEFLLELDSEFD